MQHPDSAAAPRHAQHDTLLIARLAADDLDQMDRARAEAQLDGCLECRDLRDDLVAIAAATRALPATPAPRDFRLTAEQAARLRRTWRDVVLAPFRPGRAGTRRLAATFTTLGIAGIFAVGALPALLGGGAATLAPTSAGGAGGPAATYGAPNGQFGPAAEASAAPGDASGPKDAAASPESVVNVDGDDTSRGGEAADDGRQAASRPLNVLLIGSLGLLAAGLVLFGLRLAGRRLG